MDFLLIPVCLFRSSTPQSDIPTTTHETILFHFPVYNIHVSLLCNSSYFLLFTSWTLTAIIVIPFFLLIFCLKVAQQLFFLSLHSLEETQPIFSLHPFSLQPSILFQPLLFPSGSILWFPSLMPVPLQTLHSAHQYTDAALQCWLEICCFSSHPIISALVFTLCNHNLEIFCLG